MDPTLCQRPEEVLGCACEFVVWIVVLDCSRSWSLNALSASDAVWGERDKVPNSISARKAKAVELSGKSYKTI